MNPLHDSDQGHAIYAQATTTATATATATTTTVTTRMAAMNSMDDADYGRARDL